MNSLTARFFFLVFGTFIGGAAWSSPILEPETREVIETFSGKEIALVYNYCEDKEHALTCGQLVTFHGTRSFMYNFSSLERQVGATVYYIEKPNGRFKNLLDEIFDGRVGIDKAFAYNSDIEVVFDGDGLPTARDVRVVRHGTTRFSVSDWVIHHDGLRYEGFLYDSADPDFKVAQLLRYNRVGLPIENPSDELPLVQQIKRLFAPSFYK